MSEIVGIYLHVVEPDALLAHIAARRERPSPFSDSSTSMFDEPVEIFDCGIMLFGGAAEYIPMHHPTIAFVDAETPPVGKAAEYRDMTCEGRSLLTTSTLRYECPVFFEVRGVAPDGTDVLMTRRTPLAKGTLQKQIERDIEWARRNLKDSQSDIRILLEAGDNLVPDKVAWKAAAQKCRFAGGAGGSPASPRVFTLTEHDVRNLIACDKVGEPNEKWHETLQRMDEWLSSLPPDGPA